MNLCGVRTYVTMTETIQLRVKRKGQDVNTISAMSLRCYNETIATMAQRTTPNKNTIPKRFRFKLIRSGRNASFPLWDRGFKNTCSR